MQDKNCWKEVTRSESFNLLYRYCICLAFLPAADVSNVVDDVLGPYADSIKEEMSSEVENLILTSIMVIIVIGETFL